MTTKQALNNKIVVESEYISKWMAILMCIPEQNRHKIRRLHRSKTDVLMHKERRSGPVWCRAGGRCRRRHILE